MQLPGTSNEGAHGWVHVAICGRSLGGAVAIHHDMQLAGRSNEGAHGWVQVAIFGRSLGGAVAIHLAAANPGKVAALMVENTFTSIEDVAPKVRATMRFKSAAQVLIKHVLKYYNLESMHSCPAMRFQKPTKY